MTPPLKGDRGDNSDIRDELRQAVEELRKSGTNSQLERQSINQKLDEVARKQDNLPNMLADLERRQQQALDMLRRDFERMFVPRSEYDPKHQILLDKMQGYDRIISDGQKSMEEYVTLKGTVKQAVEDIKEIQQHQASTWSRMLPWIGMLVGVGSLLFNVFQHVKITP